MTLSKHYCFTLLCGVMATATLPPLHLYPLLVPAFSGLFWLLWQAETKRRAFWTGWWFGLAYFTSGLYWFSHALLVEPEKFAWMIPFAVLGLPSILAIYYGLCCLLTRELAKRLKLSAFLSVFLFALLWLGTEWLRGQLFTGFPWNLIAYSWAFSDPMSQSVAWLGSYGLTGWTVLLATLPVIYWLGTDERQKVTALSISLLMLSMAFMAGYQRLSTNPTTYTDTVLHVVQGNIAQQHKWDPEKQYEAVQSYVKLSSDPSLPEDTVVIWPETAYPYFLEAKTPPVQFIADALPKQGVLLTGAMRAEWNKNRQGIKAFYNSVHAVRPDATVPAVYDKVRLVPFGEFVPFRGLLPVEKITHGMQDFVPGAGAGSLQLAGIPPFQPLICYEAIFPDFTVEQGDKPQWLLNVTNDAWFGMSAGPYQHMQMARFRAIEQGIPLVRAANTGISAVFDAYGRELKRLELGETGAFTLKLPHSLKPQGVVRK